MYRPPPPAPPAFSVAGLVVLFPPAPPPEPVRTRNGMAAPPGAVADAVADPPAPPAPPLPPPPPPAVLIPFAPPVSPAPGCPLIEKVLFHCVPAPPGISVLTVMALLMITSPTT